MNICVSCDQRLSPSKFYSGDNKCKECRKELVRQYRSANIEKIREYDRARGRLEHRKENVRRIHAKIKSTASGRKRLFAKQKDWQKRNSVKRAAHILVGNAVRTGKLVPTALCQRCLVEPKVEAHHEDYLKPFDVVWLCKECHGERHREINEERRRG